MKNEMGMKRERCEGYKVKRWGGQSLMCNQQFIQLRMATDPSKTKSAGPVSVTEVG
jgi:hypothetical protein